MLAGKEPFDSEARIELAQVEALAPVETLPA